MNMACLCALAVSLQSSCLSHPPNKSIFISLFTTMYQPELELTTYPTTSKNKILHPLIPQTLHTYLAKVQVISYNQGQGIGQLNINFHNLRTLNRGISKRQKKPETILRLNQRMKLPKTTTEPLRSFPKIENLIGSIVIEI